jgi:sialic acid synthase SpsE/protoporphyrinogen oxidase
MKKNKAIIIGAGPAGLVTANELAKQGWIVDIYESLDRVGGMCRSFAWNKYVVDIGPHVFHTSDKSLEKYWKEKFGDLLVEGTYWSQNVQGELFNEFYDYPLSWESISTYPEKIRKKIINEISELGLENKANAKNYKEYIDSIAGRTLREMFFERYPKKIWGISVDEMTADWAPKRVNIYKKKVPFFDRQWTAVGAKGAGAIYERISDEVQGLGGTVNLHSRITSIELDNSTINSISTNKGKIDIDQDDVIISTIPIVGLLAMLGYKSELRYRGVIIFYLDCKKERVLPDGISWQYYDSDEVYFTRVTEPKQMNIKMPVDNRTLITVEVPYSSGDWLDKKDTNILCEEIINQIIKVGLLIKGEVNDITLVKEKFVYPIQYSGYQVEVAKNESIIGKYKQLYSFGAGAKFNYTDTQVLFKKAFDLAESLTGGGNKSLNRVKQQSVAKFNETIEINKRAVGSKFIPYIIAEAGMNHNGNLNLGKKLIDAALTTGCNAIKFQTFLPDSRVSSKVKSVDFVELADGLEETMYDMFVRLAMPFSEQKQLFDYARDCGIEIFSTPFDFESVDFLESLGVNVYKIASMDLVNLPLIEYVAKTQKPLILSTGMSNIGMIEDALEVISKTGNSNVALLHCNSTYPASAEDMNVEAINTLRKCFNIPIGLSDHSFGLLVSTVALSIGADIIERHFTLSKMSEGPDHILSSEPDEMRQLVETSKVIKDILGDGIKRIKSSEYDTLNLQQKSLYALIDIKKGQEILESMLAIKGPSVGILPKYLNIVKGRVAVNDIPADYPITWKDI